MKKASFLICIVFTLQAYAQQPTDSLSIKKYTVHNDAFRHGKNLKTTSAVFLWSGLGLITVGGLMMIGNFAGNEEGTTGNNFDIGAGLAIGGACLVIASFPLRAAGKKKMKEASVVLNQSRLINGSCFISTGVKLGF